MKQQILIRCGNDFYEFSKSVTGQLDYNGKVLTEMMPDTNGYLEFTASSYFSPVFYAYLNRKLNNIPKIYVLPEVDVSDTDTFDYLVHVAPLLSAVEAKDSLLAGELYWRRCMSFEKFSKLTEYILEPICVEILFSHCFCKMDCDDPDDMPLIYNIAKKKLKFDCSRETLEQAFMRYIKNKGMEFTLPLVGTGYYNWDYEPTVLDKITDGLGYENILEKTEKIRNAKQEFFEGLELSVQAEPYNIYDKNSILVCIESIEGKLCGNNGLEKVGHVRAKAAKIIRETKPEVMGFVSELMHIGRKQYVIKIKV
ncbi:MAG: hypothetical protein MJ184_05190 [Treponema sp.]|uniref:hypothetical protein n=1 Tax=Treponema sp. TaxID=166 RepID=UPI00298D9DFB|nr:hypothetical protein [Treponema sp.]MCQ2600736.1 hypothetical protein [Treponema sp.]